VFDHEIGEPLTIDQDGPLWQVPRELQRLIAKRSTSPASGVDTELVDSLKTLDPERPIREADIIRLVLQGVREDQLSALLPPPTAVEPRPFER